MIIDFNRYNGGGGSSSAVTPEQVQQQINSALTPYWDSAITESAITEAVEGKADAKTIVDFDHTTQAERAAVYAELKTLYDGGSGATINKNYDFYKTVNTWQGLKIDYYGFSGDTMVFGKVVSPENTADQVVYEQVMTIDSAGNVNVVTNTVGGGDMSGYWNSAETKDYVDGRIDGYDSAVTLQNTGFDDLFRIKGIVNCTAGNVDFMALGATILSTTDVEPYMLKPIPQDPSLGTINYVAVGFLYETNSTSSPTGVYYGFQNNGVFVEGEPVQLIRGNVEPSTQYTTPQGRGDGYFIIDSDNYTITWSAQPVVSVHIDGVYDAIDVLDADIQELSARTIPDMSLYTPTSGFSTINGSAITNGGNIVIQGGGGDVSGYWNSAQTKSYVDNNVRGVQDQIDTMDEVVSAALVDLNERVDEISGNTGGGTDLSNYWNSAQTENAISVATQDMVTSTDIRHMVKLTQSEYDDLSVKDPETFYIIVNSN